MAKITPETIQFVTDKKEEEKMEREGKKIGWAGERIYLAGYCQTVRSDSET